ncbi:ubiquitin elongating factor core-domain-containing protein [Entophlyctis helioformis]|nr:ubiquitin elongating factor core-domain-containing protein [Entophlyctis helioformis]
MDELVAELADEAIPPVLSPAIVERVIYARLLLPANAEPGMPPLFDYLAGVWIRATRTKAAIQPFVGLADNKDAAAKAAVRVAGIDALLALAISYAGLVLNPDMIDSFPTNHTWGAGFLGYKLLESFDAESVYPREFMNDFVTRFDNDGLQEIVDFTLKGVVTAMRTQKISEDFQRPLRVLSYLVSFKQIARAITLSADWNPSYTNARTIEVLPILGPFLSRTGTFPDSDPELPSKYFPSASPFGGSAVDEYGFAIGARNAGDVRSAKTALCESGYFVHTSLHNIFLSIIKAGGDAKDNVLAFIARAIQLNHSRSKLQVDRREVSTDGFMHNLSRVCLKLCDPIMDIRFSKLALIDPNYLLYTTRIDTTDVTRILADKDAYEAHLAAWRTAHPTPPAANFVTEVFFLTLTLQHYGLLSTMRYYAGFLKELEDMRKQATKFRGIRDSGAWNNLQPHVRTANEEGLKRLEAEVDKLVGVKLAMDAALMDRVSLEHSMQFYGLVMMFLVRVANGDLEATKTVAWDRVSRGDDTDPRVKLFPLSATPPAEFTTLPEWIIDDVCEFYLFVMRYNAVMLEHHPRDEIVTFAMTVLSNPTYIKNPYLKSKLVEILFYFTIPLYRRASGETHGKLDGVFSTHPLAKAHLVRSVLGFYVDVEQTGMHSQFYDKFNIRYNISQVLKSIWNDPTHRHAIVGASRDKEFFVKFVALLMNDTTYLLDESLSKLKEIGNMQAEHAIPLPETASREDRQRRQEREGFLAQIERQATSYMSLGTETVHMLQYLTGDPDIVGPFMAPEIVERLAAMLDFNLVALAGPRCTELKVANPEKYRFDPKRLLSELIDIFLHLATRPEFITAVAKDGRSYSKPVFERAGGILSKHRLKNESELLKLREFVDAVEATIASEQLEEEEMGDVPDEFLDPLLFSLMEEPVVLPSSGVTIDLSTVKSHLLSDAHDPFNRQPLTIEQVTPNVELKEKIRAWKEERRRARKSGADAAAMDTSE